MFLVLFLAVIGIVLVAYVMFARDIARERHRVSGGSHVLESQYGPIEYALAGNGPTILSIHGTAGGFDQGLDFAEPFLGAGFRVLAPSRFGYLRSSFPADPSPARQADALATLVRKLGVQPVAAIGVSAGAHAAVELALRHPQLVSALVLVVPSAYHPGKASATPHLGRLVQAAFLLVLRFDFPFWAAIRFVPRLMVRTVLATDPALVARQPPQEQRRVRQVLWHVLPISLRFRGLRADGQAAASLGPAPYEQICAPTLTISARDDLFGTYPSAQYVAERVKHGEFVGLATGGHVLAGRSGALTHAIVRFLAKHASKTPDVAGR